MSFNDETESMIRYFLSKQISCMHSIDSNYGDFPLDEELRDAISKAIEPILERRLEIINTNVWVIRPDADVQYDDNDFSDDKYIGNLRLVLDFADDGRPEFADEILESKRFSNREEAEAYIVSVEESGLIIDEYE